MAINRRQFLALSVGSVLAARNPVQAELLTHRHWLSCQRNAAGHYALAMITESGHAAWSLALPGRGHAIVTNPRRAQAVVLARRPGAFMIVVDLPGAAIVAHVESPADRHFYGHGAFDEEGRLLYATENDFEAGAGVIGVYDAADGYRRLGEFASHGVGPHELHFLNNGRTLVIANGGIRTYPDLGRAKLNLEDMQPNLAYVDAESGKLLDAYRLPQTLHRLSIRHLAVTADNRVFIAMQYQGKSGLHPPLVATHYGEWELQLLSAPEPVETAMRNYCGSVAVDITGQLCAVTSPRGGLITLWSIHGERFLGACTLADCCGIAAGRSAGEFLVTNGDGLVARLAPNDGHWHLIPGITTTSANWDNHLTVTD